jgi:hypothetical protein
MIALVRSRNANAIDKAFHGAGKLKLEHELLLAQRDVLLGKTSSLEWDSGRWAKAKAQLLRETSGKCAYCEASFTAVSFGDVEHFRPKSVYWWLAYCYDNYLASCQICNQSFKRDLFPLQASSKVFPAPKVQKKSTDAKLLTLLGKSYPDPLEAAAVKAFVKTHLQEKPLLLNPYFEDPNNILIWQADKVLKEVEILPAPNVQGALERFNAMNEIFGFNRLELRKLRYQVYLMLRVALKGLNNPRLTNTEKQDFQELLQSLRSPEQSFLGMVQYFERIGI